MERYKTLSCRRNIAPSDLKCSCLPGAAKSNPLKSFAVFPATAWNFCVKFYMFTWLSYLLNCQDLIIFKYDEIIDILAWLLSNFRAAEKRLRRNTAKQRHWNNTVNTLSYVWIWQSLCFLILFSVRFVHVFSHSVKLLTALLINFWGRLSKITCNASLSSVIDLRFGWSLW